MIFILNALCLSGLLFCAETTNPNTVFKFDCIDLDNEPTAFRVRCTDGTKIKLGAESFFKFYQCSPTLQKSFESLNDEYVSFPTDGETFTLLYDLITIHPDTARIKLEQMDSQKGMQVLTGLMDLEAVDTIRSLYKNLVFLQFDNNNYCFSPLSRWNKYKSELIRVSKPSIHGLAVENYRMSFSDTDLVNYIKLLNNRPTGTLIHSWLKKIAGFTFTKYALPMIDQTRLNALSVSRVAFSKDFKRFSLLCCNNDVSQMFEYHYSKIQDKYICADEKIQIHECWYEQNHARIARHTSNFYAIDNLKRYLASVESNIGPCSYDNGIIAIAFSSKVILKKIGMSQKITSETHKFNNYIKQIIPFQKGFLVQFCDGAVSTLIPGQTIHCLLPLKVEINDTIKRLMFNENALLVKDDTYNTLKMYPISEGYVISNHIPIQVPMDTLMYEVHDDAILTYHDGSVHCLSYTQPFIDALNAVNTGNTDALSRIYDTITLNQ